MKMFSAQKNEIIEWIHELSKTKETFFPQKKGKANYLFSPINDKSILQFENYIPTITPPGKKLTPAMEKLFKFKTEGENITYTPHLDQAERILAGVRPCDLKGIFLMDLVYQENIVDPHYFARRENTAIIGYVCPKKCDESCFCESVGALDFEQGADILLFDDGEIFLVESKTKKGDALLEGKNFLECTDGMQKKEKTKSNRAKPFGRNINGEINRLPALLKKHWASAIWEKHTQRCFSCGTCNLVCPTCYCFEVKDDLALDVKSGEKTRTWDSCMLQNFAVVAGGHNFRQKPESRQRHRVKRKFEYLMEKYNQGSFCVGCGRCGRQCTAGIDIFDIVNDVIEADGVKHG